MRRERKRDVLIIWIRKTGYRILFLLFSDNALWFYIYLPTCMMNHIPYETHEMWFLSPCRVEWGASNYNPYCLGSRLDILDLLRYYLQWIHIFLFLQFNGKSRCKAQRQEQFLKPWVVCFPENFKRHFSKPFQKLWRKSQLHSCETWNQCNVSQFEAMEFQLGIIMPWSMMYVIRLLTLFYLTKQIANSCLFVSQGDGYLF